MFMTSKPHRNLWWGFVFCVWSKTITNSIYIKDFLISEYYKTSVERYVDCAIREILERAEEIALAVDVSWHFHEPRIEHHSQNAREVLH